MGQSGISLYSIIRGNQPASAALQLFFESLYISISTMTTVGFAGGVPQTTVARIASAVQASVGIVFVILLGYILGKRQSI
jgi:hypothetical protein